MVLGVVAGQPVVGETQSSAALALGTGSASCCVVRGWVLGLQYKTAPRGVARFFVQLPELPKDAPALRAPELPAIKVGGCCRRCEWEAGNTVCCLLP